MPFLIPVKYRKKMQTGSFFRALSLRIRQTCSSMSGLPLNALLTYRFQKDKMKRMRGWKSGHRMNDDVFGRERGTALEKRKVTILVDGQTCCFYSDDSDEYISTLAEKANAVIRQTAKDSGTSGKTNAVLSVLALTDMLLQTEQRMRDMAAEKKEAAVREPAEAKRLNSRKTASKAAEENPGQVSVWDLLK